MATRQKKAKVIGLGSYLPEGVLSNEDLERMIETSDEWIVTRTGIRERRIASEEEFPSEMGAIAAQKALEQAEVAVGEIDLLLVATMTPDYLCPATSAFIQHKLGLKGVAAMDLQAACSGFLYGLATAKAFVESGMAVNVLLIATEKMSAVTDFSDRKSCILFGDGASAAVVSAEGVGFSIEGIELGADGELADLIMVPAGGARVPATADTVASGQHFVSLKGQEVFKHAVRRMTEASESCLAKIGWAAREIGWLVPHQANGRIMEALGKQLGVPEERVFRTVHKYGNTSASSVGIALEELVSTHPFLEGEKALLVAFGAGLTWGAAALRWN